MGPGNGLSGPGRGPGADRDAAAATDAAAVTDADAGWMRLALDLAATGEGHVEPNPMVGCVLVRDGRLIGRGYHRRFGGPHAEADALAGCDDARGATAYVTLEPCCHQGKTPPCADALITAGVIRVVAAMRDPFPKVDGGGLARLTAAGIEVRVGLLQDQAEELNAAYLKRVRLGLPWVIAKWAMTLDGRIATVAGESQWITGPAARRETHRLRGRVDAVAVGMGTVVADDPRLTARDIDGPPPRHAARVVFCRHRVPSPRSRLLADLPQAPLVIVAGPAVDPLALARLRDAGATTWETESADPRAAVTQALRRSVERPWGEGSPATTWMVEGGGRLLASFFEADHIDEVHVYLGPRLFGGQAAPGPIAGAGIDRLASAPRFRLTSLDRLEDDARLVFRRQDPSRQDPGRQAKKFSESPGRG